MKSFESVFSATWKRSPRTCSPAPAASGPGLRELPAWPAMMVAVLTVRSPEDTSPQPVRVLDAHEAAPPAAACRYTRWRPGRIAPEASRAPCPHRPRRRRLLEGHGHWLASPAVVEAAMKAVRGRTKYVANLERPATPANHQAGAVAARRARVARLTGTLSTSRKFRPTHVHVHLARRLDVRQLRLDLAQVGNRTARCRCRWNSPMR